MPHIRPSVDDGSQRELTGNVVTDGRHIFSVPFWASRNRLRDILHDLAGYVPQAYERSCDRQWATGLVRQLQQELQYSAVESPLACTARLSTFGD
jgi:hypothetical protein